MRAGRRREDQHGPGIGIGVADVIAAVDQAVPVNIVLGQRGLEHVGFGCGHDERRAGQHDPGAERQPAEALQRIERRLPRVLGVAAEIQIGIAGAQRARPRHDATGTDCRAGRQAVQPDARHSQASGSEDVSGNRHRRAEHGVGRRPRKRQTRCAGDFAHGGDGGVVDIHRARVGAVHIGQGRADDQVVARRDQRLTEAQIAVAGWRSERLQRGAGRRSRKALAEHLIDGERRAEAARQVACRNGHIVPDGCHCVSESAAGDDGARPGMPVRLDNRSRLTVEQIGHALPGGRAGIAHQEVVAGKGDRKPEMGLDVAQTRQTTEADRGAVRYGTAQRLQKRARGQVEQVRRTAQRLARSVQRGGIGRPDQQAVVGDGQRIAEPFRRAGQRAAEDLLRSLVEDRASIRVPGERQHRAFAGVAGEDQGVRHGDCAAQVVDAGGRRQQPRTGRNLREAQAHVRRIHDQPGVRRQRAGPLGAAVEDERFTRSARGFLHVDDQVVLSVAVAVASRGRVEPAAESGDRHVGLCGDVDR